MIPILIPIHISVSTDDLPGFSGYFIFPTNQDEGCVEEIKRKAKDACEKAKEGGSVRCHVLIEAITKALEGLAEVAEFKHQLNVCTEKRVN